LRQRLADRISAILPKCKGVWLRDPQSAAMLAATGFADAKVTADTAVLMGNGERGTADAKAMAVELGNGEWESTLGLCISTQRQVADLDGLKGLIAAVRSSGAKVVGIPMNPKTDRALLDRLGVESIAGTTPEAVVAAAANCNVVLSSRLHLLILAANAGTPGIGIARGSKLANWLSNFNRTVAGSVYDCDWKKVTGEVLAALADRGDWDAVRNAAYAKLMARLEKARKELVASLEACHAG
jgi:polysaccharide pyruvyl transferase WcaK-like protein